jgi:hypothetical protein
MTSGSCGVVVSGIPIIGADGAKLGGIDVMGTAGAAADDEGITMLLLLVLLGKSEGARLGAATNIEGIRLGIVEAMVEGTRVGVAEGNRVGVVEGNILGDDVGTMEGIRLGGSVGGTRISNPEVELEPPSASKNSAKRMTDTIIRNTKTI